MTERRYMMRNVTSAKRDANEAEIRQRFLAYGIHTWQLSATDVPDLLGRYPGGWFLVEVKAEGKKLRDGQAEFIARAEEYDCPCYIAWGVDDVDIIVQDLGARYGQLRSREPG
jgi:hypothetical protein